jgi:PhoPQ-activated pathogenicity-related protein
MMMDWTNIWYDSMPGESHLLIAQNSEHSLATGIPELVPSLANMLGSIAAGHTREQRPDFKYTFDNTTGRITVMIPKTMPAKTVKIWHAETLQSERRCDCRPDQTRSDQIDTVYPTRLDKPPDQPLQCFV